MRISANIILYSDGKIIYTGIWFGKKSTKFLFALLGFPSYQLSSDQLQTCNSI